MLCKEHQQAQLYAIKAAAAVSGNRKDVARLYYSKAAELEKKALAIIDPKALRTKSILAVSMASLFYKAQDFNRAEKEIFRLLADVNLTSSAELQLRELLEVVSDENCLLKAGAHYGEDDDICVSLRGGQIGFGTAPMDIALKNYVGMNSIFQRLMEYRIGKPLRKSGPPTDIDELIQARVKQPMAGSYKFTVKFAEPTDRSLFPVENVNPGGICETLMSLFGCASTGEDDKLNKLIDNDEYRVTLLKLVRNIIPTDEKSIKEIEISTTSNRSIYKSVILNTNTRKTVNAIIRHHAKPDTRNDTDTLIGTLRAVDLDDHWLEIAMDGKKQTCSMKAEMLDDIIGPMVNKRVVLTGKYNGKTFEIDDIDLDHVD